MIRVDKKRRVISFLLAILLVFQLVPMFTFASSDITGVGTGTGSGGAEGKGRWSTSQEGYRIYMIDKEGNLRSNVIDFVFSDPTKLGLTIHWNYTTKIEKFGYSVGGQDPNKMILISDVKENWYPSGTQWPLPIYYTNKAMSHGEEIKKWFLQGTYIKSSATGTGSKGIVNNYNGTNTNKPSSQKPSTPSNSTDNNNTNTGNSNTNNPNVLPESTYLYASSVTKQMNNVFYNYKSLGYSKGAALNSAVSKGNTILNSWISCNIFTNQQISYISAAIVKEANELKQVPQWNYTRGSEYDDYKGLEANIFTFLNPVYAAETEGNKATENGNLLKIMDHKINNKFIFSINGTEMYTNEKGEESIVVTACANQLIVMVEPLFYVRPAVAGLSSEANYIFFGTPTNYGQYMLAAKAAGQWYDGGYGGHYGVCFNRLGKGCMYIDEDLKLGNMTIKIPPNPGTTIPHSELADATLGYALQYFYCKGGSELPATPTYDYYSTDPNPNPHPAPDPDPSKYIKLTNQELKEPGDPITLDNPNPENKGYLNTTRTIHIVKVYEHEDILGNISHVKTTFRDNCPGTIYVEHEPDYKVVGYFSSDVYYGDYYDTVQDVTWDLIATEIENKHDYRDYAEDESCVSSNPITWDEVKDATEKSCIFTAKLGVACTCGLPEDKKANVNYNDPDTLAQLEQGEHYKDNTLYVRLILKDKKPETSTWDEVAYPEGEPGPAPVPPKKPEPIPGINIDDIYPFNINIVKVYRTKDLNTGDYVHDGTYVRQENPETITIEDEPKYKLTKWFESVDYIDPDFTTTWEEVEGQARVTGNSGTQEAKIEVTKPNTTLYVLLEKTEKVSPQIKVTNQISESQLTKSIATSYILDGSNWGDYWYKAEVDEAYRVHVNGACDCYDEEVDDDNDDGGSSFIHHHSHTSITHMTRADKSMGDNKVWSTWTGLHSAKSLETKSKASANSDFKSLVLSEGKKGESITLDKYNDNPEVVSDNAHSWTLNKDFTTDTGISYFTTIWRGPYDPNVTLATYKKSAINSDSWTRVSSIFPSGNKPAGKRMTERNKVYHDMLITLGISSKDDSVTSACGDIRHYCCCCTISPSSNTKTLRFTDSDGGDGTRIDFKGDFFILAYAGKDKPTASVQVKNLKEFAMSINGASTLRTAHFAKTGNSNISFYPYVRMSYMITTDGSGETGWTEPEYSNLQLQSVEQQNYLKDRTVYVLSDKKSTIIPTNAIDVGWYNETQASNGYGLQMTSQQWSVHARATTGEGWRQKNQVLPGGALYLLNTKDTETVVKAVTYSTLVENDSRTWITLSNQSEYTTDSIINENDNFIKEFKDCLENLKIVQWVNKDWSVANPWSTSTGAVKIEKGGESLSELGLNTKASTDAKYLLFAGSANNDRGASEADIDIERESYQTTLYKAFTDTEGNVYIAQAQMKLANKQLTNEQLNTLVSVLKNTNGTNTKLGTATDIETKILKIGTKDTNTSKIIESLKSNSEYNYLYMLDLKTGFISNILNSVNRNQGDDDLNAWVKDEKWYNEAFDGIYVVQQSITYKVGLQAPARRTSVLDPNLCPAKNSTGDTFTTAFISQFRLNDKSYSEYAKDKDAGYVGTFYGIPVIMPDMENMYYTRPFYIPNGNVQDLT